MNGSLIVWDLETVPDLRGFAAANGLVGKTDDEVHEAIGDKFPKHIYHSIVDRGTGKRRPLGGGRPRSPSRRRQNREAADIHPNRRRVFTNS